MQGRLLPLSVGTATWNMAVDQAIFESVEQSGIPTLRFYGWLEPTLSLGYFQSYGSRDQHAASQDAACVRRSTGGGAILHDQELTYCLAMPIEASATRQRQQLYQQVHQAFATMLGSRGVRATPYRLDGRVAGSDSSLLCFQRRTDEDLIVSGYKVLGSAQRRSRHAVVQHGSLLLVASPFAPELPGVCDLTSRLIDAPEVMGPISQQISDFTGIQWESAVLTDGERRRAAQVESGRFAARAWLCRR